MKRRPKPTPTATIAGRTLPVRRPTPEEFRTSLRRVVARHAAAIRNLKDR